MVFVVVQEHELMRLHRCRSLSWPFGVRRLVGRIARDRTGVVLQSRVMEHQRRVGIGQGMAVGAEAGIDYRKDPGEVRRMGHWVEGHRSYHKAAVEMGVVGVVERRSHLDLEG